MKLDLVSWLRVRLASWILGKRLWRKLREWERKEPVARESSGKEGT